MKNNNIVVAVKGNLETKFSRISWDLMGKNKNGWIEVDINGSGDDIPVEVKEILNKPVKKADNFKEVDVIEEVSVNLTQHQDEQITVDDLTKEINGDEHIVIPINWKARISFIKSCNDISVIKGLSKNDKVQKVKDAAIYRLNELS